MQSYFFKSALLPKGWCQGVRVSTSEGVFKAVETNCQARPEDRCFNQVIPAIPNVHSHVFQRAMAGLSEYRKAPMVGSLNSGGSVDSFWSWRDLMYQLAQQMDGQSLYQIAVQCYTQMRDAGYASVCEFHYLHRDKERSEDFFSHSEILLKAAAEVGLPITLLPVLYAFSAVGEKPLNPEQRRFELSVDEYIELYNHLQTKLQDRQNLGICFHSIRAVNQQQMQAVIDALPQDAPIHIHIAEQQAEIDQAIKYYGTRPVTWLFDHFKVDKRWCLVHATHLDEHEVKLIADSGAVTVICPLTEANLGDGIFPMPAYMANDGVWAIGSDSHIEIQPQQELKILEYSQRLWHQQRNVCCDDRQPHVGTWLWLRAVAGGNQACQLIRNGIEVGCSARVIDLQPTNVMNAESALDGWIFSDQVKAVASTL